MAVAEVRARVRDQSLGIAAGWSPPGAPPEWALTAETYRAIATDDVLLDLAAAIPADRLPPLLLSAALRRLVARDRPALAAFVRERAGELADLCTRHRYQMNEVARSADVLAVLAGLPDRPVALVDLGTGAGLGLQLDRDAYRVGDQVLGGSALVLAPELRGAPPPPLRMPAVAARVGVDAEPLDLDDAEIRAWLAACVPPEIGAVERFAAATSIVRAHPAPLVRGDVVEALPAVCAELPDDALLVLVDAYVHVFLSDAERARFRDLLPTLGRDVEWISVDPLVPLGPDARDSVQGLPVPPRALAAAREGVTGVVGRLSVRDGVTSGAVLGLAHPGGAWLEWFSAPG